VFYSTRSRSAETFSLSKKLLWLGMLIGQFLPDKCMMMHKGSGRDKITKTLTDIVKAVLAQPTALPCFYAINLSRLPQVSVDHVDVSAILHELVALWREVQSIAELRSETEELRCTVRQSDCLLQIEPWSSA